MKWSESHSVVSNYLRPHGLYSPWSSPGQNTGVGSVCLIQGIFPTQGLNPGLLHCRQILYQLSYERSPHVYLSTLCLFKTLCVCIQCSSQLESFFSMIQSRSNILQSSSPKKAFPDYYRYSFSLKSMAFSLNYMALYVLLKCTVC